MWSYEQVTGYLRNSAGNVLGIGYSGKDEGKNNPARQAQHNLGPIPCGVYVIQQPQHTVTHGPFVLPLLAMAENEMFGRYGFLIHGDSVIQPGTASEGCIVLARDLRERIWTSGDRGLKVISGMEGK